LQGRCGAGRQGGSDNGLGAPGSGRKLISTAPMATPGNRRGPKVTALAMAMPAGRNSGLA
jgi:hypothetical protein